MLFQYPARDEGEKEMLFQYPAMDEGEEGDVVPIPRKGQREEDVELKRLHTWKYNESKVCLEN